MSRHNYSQYSNHKNQHNVNEVEVTETAVEVAPEVDTATIIENTNPEIVLAAPETAPATETVTGVVVNCAKLNVRANPSTDADVVCVLNAASEIEVNVAESNDEWVKVCTATGIDGYCMRKFIDVNL